MAVILSTYKLTESDTKLLTVWAKLASGEMMKALQASSLSSYVDMSSVQVSLLQDYTQADGDQIPVQKLADLAIYQYEKPQLNLKSRTLTRGILSLTVKKLHTARISTPALHVLLDQLHKDVVSNLIQCGEQTAEMASAFINIYGCVPRVESVGTFPGGDEPDTAFWASSPSHRYSSDRFFIQCRFSLQLIAVQPQAGKIMFIS